MSMIVLFITENNIGDIHSMNVSSLDLLIGIRTKASKYKGTAILKIVRCDLRKINIIQPLNEGPKHKQCIADITRRSLT